MRGYAPRAADAVADNGDAQRAQQALIELAQRKQELLHELAGYESAVAAAEAAASTAAQPRRGGGGSSGGGGSGGAGGAASNGTRIDGAIAINKATMRCELTLATSDESVIKVWVLAG